MSIANIKNKSQGFTIVELLIVVVVIAILAAITIVSYNGITNRANASAAKSTAASLQKKVELYFAEESSYPTGLSQLTGASASEAYSMSSGSVYISGATDPGTSNGKNTVRVVPCTNGLQIRYYDFEDSTVKSIQVGSATGCTGSWTAVTS